MFYLIICNFPETTVPYFHTYQTNQIRLPQPPKNSPYSRTYPRPNCASATSARNTAKSANTTTQSSCTTYANTVCETAPSRPPQRWRPAAAMSSGSSPATGCDSIGRPRESHPPTLRCGRRLAANAAIRAASTCDVVICILRELRSIGA